jgi:hypothetical protein
MRRNDVMAGFNRILETPLRSHTDEECCRVYLEVTETITCSKISFIGEIGADDILQDLPISNSAWNICTPHDSVRD